MDDKDLEALKKLIETGNVTRAAQELFTTQPSLTKRLQKIEAELGGSVEKYVVDKADPQIGIE